ncbi:unnamed protein product, partial [Musa acuminata var. zebrina]
MKGDLLEGVWSFSLSLPPNTKVKPAKRSVAHAITFRHHQLNLCYKFASVITQVRHQKNRRATGG